MTRNPEKLRAWCEANRERRREYNAKWRAEHPERAVKQNAKWRVEHPEYKTEYNRQKWQRTGRGIHMARVQDWKEFFDGLSNDRERTVAAFMLLTLAPIDAGTYAVVVDPSFDWNYIAPYTED